MQHVWDEIAHVDGGTHRAIKKEKGSEEGRQGIRFELQLPQEPQCQQIARFTSGEHKSAAISQSLYEMILKYRKSAVILFFS